MSTGRRIIIGSRQGQREPGRASYQDSDKKSDVDYAQYSRSPKNYLIPPRHDDRMKYSQFPRTPSESNIRPRQQYFKSSIARRKNDGVVSNLKSQLQNLKMQVNKLVDKQKDTRMTHSGIQQVYKSMAQSNASGSQRSLRDNNRLTLDKYGKDVSDMISVTSENLIDGPLKRLQNEYQSDQYDHAHYLQLQNNVLKTQLRNLKNKYNATKQQLKERCEAFERKNQYLEISLKKSQKQLYQCKKNLQVQLQTIKFQLSRRYQQQSQQQQRRYEKMQPQRDLPLGNEHLEQKMKKLYEQLSDKTRKINNMNIQLNQVQGELEKRKFELKKQIQKNNQITKQLEISKRQISRTQVLLENQANKKQQLQKTNDSLRIKLDQLTQDLQHKDTIVSGSQQFQHKLQSQLNFYKQQQHRLSQQNCQLTVQIRKLRQLIESNDQQIAYLKKNINQFTNQLEQGSRNLRNQKEKAMQIEQYYRKALDEAKINSEREIQNLQKECSKLRQQIDCGGYTGSPERNYEQNTKNTKNQANRWKAEYKVLKVKFQELITSQNHKKQQIETYYKSYKQYKSKNKILQMRNKILQDSANQYIEKIQQIQAANLSERQKNLQKIRHLQSQLNAINKDYQIISEDYKQLQAKFAEKTQMLEWQQKYRKDIQQKVLNIDIEDHEGLTQIIQVIRNRTEQQDEKINKYIKQIKSKQALITKLRNQVKQMIDSQQQQFQAFRIRQVNDKVQQIQNTTFQALKQFKELARKDLELQREEKDQILKESSQMKAHLSQIQANLINLRQQNNNLSNLYNNRSEEISHIQQNYQNQIANLSQSYQQKIRDSSNFIQQLKSRIAMHQEQIIGLRAETMKFYGMRMDIQNMSFDQILKNQMESNKKLRQELSKKNQQVYRLRDSLSNMKAELDTVKSSADVGRLRFIADKKNIQVNFQVQIQKLKNSISIQQKKISSLQQKIRMVVDQNRKKDTFIQTYIMGKKLPVKDKQFMTAFLKQYEITVTGKHISDKLQGQSKQLQKMEIYNSNLMRQISELRNKLHIYEGQDDDQFQIEESLMSSKISESNYN